MPVRLEEGSDSVELDLTSRSPSSSTIFSTLTFTDAESAAAYSSFNYYDLNLSRLMMIWTAVASAAARRRAFRGHCQRVTRTQSGMTVPVTASVTLRREALQVTQVSRLIEPACLLV